METTVTKGPATGSVGQAISLRDVSIYYGEQEVVHAFSLDVEPGQFLCILGPSGCGKSTVLNTIAGFHTDRDGEVQVGREPVTGPDPTRGVVFQSSDVLFPWLTAAQNVSFGPRMQRLSKTECRAAANHYLELTGLSEHADQYPHELSGGMRQRIQIARVLANEPDVVLMDEPFGALDAQTREVMQEELVRIWEQSGKTIVFITHDVNESIVLADSIAIMSCGPAAALKEVVDNPLERPRRLTDPGALEIYEHVRGSIAEEVRKSMGIATPGRASEQ